MGERGGGRKGERGGGERRGQGRGMLHVIHYLKF